MDQQKLIPALPAPAEPLVGRNLPAPLDMYRVNMTAAAAEAEPSTEPAPLSHYLWILRRHWWKISLFVVFTVAATLAISLRLTPIYESTATIDIDRQMPSGIIGQEATRTMANDSEQFLATQAKLIQSDSVLRPVALQYNLLEAEGAASEASNPTAQDAPVLLKQLRVSRPPNTYLLLINYRSADPRLAADVSNAIARSYLEHTYNIRYKSSASLSAFMERQLEELKAKMERSSGALAQFERELNVINPEQKTSILSARLLQLNTEYTNAQADRVRKEAAFQSVSAGTLEAAQVSTQGEALKRHTERIDEQKARFTEIKAHYGPTHPEYRKASLQLAELQRQLDGIRVNIGQRVEVDYRESLNREAMLQKAVAETKAEFDRINARSFQYQSLKREAEADKNLYEELVRKIKEATINSGFQNSAIRIADLARPAVKAVFPNIKLNVLLALVFSLLLAVAAATVADMLNNTVRDPEQVTRTLATEVIGTLPSVKEWQGGLIPASEVSNALVLRDGAMAGLSAFQEAIRTLRNSILLTDFDRRIRSLMVTSSGPSEGKSTTAAHLALAHAQQGRRTLLIDGDLRRPSIHRRFEIPSVKGLSSVLTTGVDWRSVLVKHPGLPALDILPAGPPSRRAADLVGAELTALLEDACSEYDLVVLDSPPLLGFPEPLQMAASVDGVLAVALAGRTNRKALASTVTTLKRLRANVVGVVLNEVRADSSENYYYHYGPTYYKHYNVEAETEA